MTVNNIYKNKHKYNDLSICGIYANMTSSPIVYMNLGAQAALKDISGKLIEIFSLVLKSMEHTVKTKTLWFIST